MTEHNPYPAQVADLITQAFDNLGTGLTRESWADRVNHLEEAKLRMAAAQAIATLAHAHETRTLALVTLAGLEPAKVEQAGPLPQEALLAAARALGLVEEEDPDRIDPAAFNQFLAERDAQTDKELGDLP